MICIPQAVLIRGCVGYLSIQLEVTLQLYYICLSSQKLHCSCTVSVYLARSDIVVVRYLYLARSDVVVVRYLSIQLEVTLQLSVCQDNYKQVRAQQIQRRICQSVFNKQLFIVVPILFHDVVRSFIEFYIFKIRDIVCY